MGKHGEVKTGGSLFERFRIWAKGKPEAWQTYTPLHEWANPVTVGLDREPREVPGGRNTGKVEVRLSAEDMERIRANEERFSKFPLKDGAQALAYGVGADWPEPKLDVRTVDLLGGMGLALFDRETGQVLPGQRSGSMDYSAVDYPTLRVEFVVDGDRVKLGDNTKAFQADHDAAIAKAEAAMEERDAANDLQAALRAFGGLTDANADRFMAALGFRCRIEGEDTLMGLAREIRDQKLAAAAEKAAEPPSYVNAGEFMELRALRGFLVDLLKLNGERRGHRSLQKAVRMLQAEARGLLQRPWSSEVHTITLKVTPDPTHPEI